MHDEAFVVWFSLRSRGTEVSEVRKIAKNASGKCSASEYNVTILLSYQSTDILLKLNYVNWTATDLRNHLVILSAQGSCTRKLMHTSA